MQTNKLRAGASIGGYWSVWDTEKDEVIASADTQQWANDIVRAVNAHQALVDALKVAEEWLIEAKANEPEDYENDPLDENLKQIAAALTLAGVPE